jgi:hypothetical protein
MRYLIGRSAIATALANPSLAATRLAVARRQAVALGGESVPWASAIGALLSACTAAAAGELIPALRGYADAEERLIRCALRLHGQVARLVRGGLQAGDQGAELRASAMDWMRDQAIVHPVRFSQVFAPRR